MIDPGEVERQLAKNLSSKKNLSVGVEKALVSSEAPVDTSAEPDVDEENPVGEGEEERNNSSLDGAGLQTSEGEPGISPIPAPIEDESVEAAVDDIIAQESDDLLEAEDTIRSQSAVAPKVGLGTRIKNNWIWWWHNPKTRWATLVAILLLIVGLAFWPSSRYLILNTVGVRSSASMRIVDGSTTQPLKNVEIEMAGQTGKTDQDGNVRLSNLQLGPTEMVIKKRAFAEVRRPLVIGWGSNPIGEMALSATGTQYSLKITDYLSGKPIEKVEATSGEFSAISDKDGKISLAIETKSEADPEIIVDNEQYRIEKFTGVETVEKELKLVPRRPHVFVSKRSGRYDVYKIDADGKNEAIVLAGSGREREDMALLPKPNDKIVAHVSTRDNQRNKDGYLLSSLYLLDSETGEKTRLNLSERIQLIGWHKNDLIYVSVTEGASGANPNRQKLYSYSTENEESKELASANHFGGVLIAAGLIYYAPSNIYNQPAQEKGLYRINSDGTNKQNVLNRDVWNVFRASYDRLVVAGPDEWNEYKIDGGVTTKLPGQPADLKSYLFVASPDGSTELWVDERDGKGVLLALEPSSKKEAVVASRSGLTQPVHWLNNSTVVYRVLDGREVADYAINVAGGEAQKLRDVTNTGSLSQVGY